MNALVVAEGWRLLERHWIVAGEEGNAMKIKTRSSADKWWKAVE